MATRLALIPPTSVLAWMKKALVFLLLLSLLRSTNGAENAPTFVWAKGSETLGNGAVGAVAMDSLGNAYMTGNFVGTVTFGTNVLTSIGVFGGFIAKLDPDGSFLWARSVVGGNECNPYSIALDSLGNPYVAGLFRSPGTFGTNTLTKQFGDRDAFVTKLDPDGNFLWAVRAGGDGDDFATSVAVDGTGGIFLGGYFERTVTFGTTTLTNGTFFQSGEGFVARLDGAGNFLWAKRAGANEEHHPLSVASDMVGNAYVAGSSRGNASFGTNSLSSGAYFNAFIAKLDGRGNYLWVRQAGGGTNSNKDSEAFALAIAPNGRIIVVGNFISSLVVGSNTLTSAGDRDVFVTQLNDGGDFQWAVSGGGSSLDVANAVAVDLAGSVYVAGLYSSRAIFGQTSLDNTNGAEDVFIIKLDRDGRYLWAMTGGGTNGDQAYGVSVDVKGNVCVGGYHVGPAFFGNVALSRDTGDIGAPFVARLLSTPPVLTASRVASGLDLRWPDTTLGFRLETSTSLAPSLWLPATGSLQTNGGSISVALPISGARRFYRLGQP